MEVVVLESMELKVLLDKVELVLIIFLDKQQVDVVFVEIVVISEQGTRIMQGVIMQEDVPVVVGGSGLVVQTIQDQQQSVVNKTHKLLQVGQVEMVEMVVEEEDLIFNLVHQQVQLGDQVQRLQVVVDLLVQ